MFLTFSFGTTSPLPPNSSVFLINGAESANVKWCIGLAATFGAGSHFEGSLEAGGAITVGASTVVMGSLTAGAALTIGASATIEGCVEAVGAITQGAGAVVTCEPAPVSTGATCFPGDATLTLEDGNAKMFRDLAVGDKVLSADRYGTISASKVVFLPHKPNDIKRNFDMVTTSSGKTLTMTKNHLLPLCDGSLVTARSVSVGQCLKTVDGDEVVASLVLDKEFDGLYTAVTENEFLVVNGVVASPFALAHGVAHAYFNRTDSEEWCHDNEYLLGEAATEVVKDLTSRRRLSAGPSGCAALLETMFENYQEHGVGWGSSGWGYRNFQTTQGEKKVAPMPLLLAGWEGKAV